MKQSSKRLNQHDDKEICKNSLLTDLMKEKRFLVIHRLFNIAFVVLLSYVGRYYYEHPNVFYHHIHTIAWSMSNLGFFTKMWMSYHLFAFTVFFGFRYWLKMRKAINSNMLVNLVFLLLYIIHVILMLVAPPFHVLQTTIRPVTNLALALEQIRICMKCHSFVRETTSKVLRSESSKALKEYEQYYPSLKHYLYFLFSPTFIYRESYKRRKDICFKLLMSNFVCFLTSVVIAYPIMTFLVIDLFQDVGQRPLNAWETLELASASAFAGFVFLMLIGVGFLHAWLNVFAELTRFGDRQFYMDWWNCKTFAEGIKKWNYIVHEWIRAYLYLDLIKIGCGKVTASALSALLSGIFHEYVLFQTFGFFYPILFVIFGVIGSFILLLSWREDRPLLMTSMKLAMPFVSGICVFAYATEWYARKNCPRGENSLAEFFVPRSWEKSYKIFDFH